jgi:amidase
LAKCLASSGPPPNIARETDQIPVLIDDPEIYHGAPVAVQLVGRRFQEEKMLALAEYIGDLLSQL